MPFSKPVAGYPSRKAAILDLHARGVAEPTIAAELGLKVAIVRARIHEAGRRPNRPGRTRPGPDATPPAAAPPAADPAPAQAPAEEPPMTKSIMISLPDAVHAGLERLAGAAKVPVGRYAQELLVAAYSARVKPPTGDRNLDAAVARVAILYAEDRDAEDIARAVGLSAATVERVIATWRAEAGCAA